MKLLEAKDIWKVYPGRSGFRSKDSGVQALRGVTFDLKEGEIIALIGESGSGKSTLSRQILGLEEPTRGEVRYRGEKVSGMTQSQKKTFRKKAQMIFQDPFGSLNPRMRIWKIVGEGLLIHEKMSKADVQSKVGDLLELVGLSKDMMRRYPHEFSGGQRQRIAIARALALDPQFIIADEPVSSLDVSVQAQILNLLKDIQAQRNLSYILISHDLRVVEYFADRVMVMYMGKIVETLPAEGLLDKAKHPYTKALFKSVFHIDDAPFDRTQVLSGEMPDITEVIHGCSFKSRCPIAEDLCTKDDPELRNLGNHMEVACHVVEKTADHQRH